MLTAKMQPAIGNEYKSNWELKVTIINIRNIEAKRNILISYTNEVTGKNESALVSERQLAKWYPYFVGVNESIAKTALQLGMVRND